MKKSTLLLTATLAALTFTACSVKSGNDQLNSKTQAQMEQSIVKGKTTEAQVKQMFGEPQEKDIMQTGDAKWIYKHITRESKAINYIPVANWFASGTNDTTKSLVVVFTSDGIVKNYTVSVAEGETMGGLVGGTSK